MAVEIRLANASEAAALTALAHRAKAHWGYPAEWIAHWQADLTLTPAYLMAHHAFVAVHESRLVGVCVLQRISAGAALEHVWVAPEHQGKGIGRELVAHALARAAELGVSRVEVHSDPFAESFYLRLGARRVGSVPAPMPGAPERMLPRLEFRV